VETPGTAPGSDPLITSAFMSIAELPQRSLYRGRARRVQEKGLGQTSLHFAFLVLRPEVYTRFMNSIEQKLEDWNASLLANLSKGGLISRNPTAHKWNAPFRCFILREAAFWRITDLMTQSYALHQQGHVLGARILLRSGIETVAMFIYLNQLMQKVVNETLDFHAFSDRTVLLVLGSRNGTTPHEAVNITTILEKCDKRYPGIVKAYGDLSESAHPNYQVMIAGCSKVDHVELETQFSNTWMELYGDSHLNLMEMCMSTFQHEYDIVWTEYITTLENWIDAHDTKLEASKSDP
jgi:hypothetical protein